MKIITEIADLAPAYPMDVYAPEEEILFFDIETTGLRKESSQVYLIGCAFLERTEEGEAFWKIRQYLAESALDEREVMEAFSEFAHGFSTLVHFNGDGFDIPYLAYKAEYYDLDLDFSRFQSIDIYRLAKPLKKLLQLPNMKQKSIEGFLQIGRDDLYNGGELIPVYYEYERSGSEEAEHLLLLHNFEDVKGMMHLVSILAYCQLTDGTFSFRDLEVSGDTAVFAFRLERPLPKELEYETEKGRIRIFAGDDLLQLSVRIFEGIARLPLPDVENYYYLPEEDRVIHKDVAQFVDKSHRKKATKKNCYLKKEGRFLPQKQVLFTPAFEVEGEPKKTFFELDICGSTDHRILTEYALDIILW